MYRIVGVAVVLLLAGCASSPPAAAPTVASSSPAPDYTGLPDKFAGTGSFVAGVDIQPGTYLVVEKHDTCVWYLGVDGELVASGANDVVVAAGETVEVSGCAVFELAG